MAINVVPAAAQQQPAPGAWTSGTDVKPQSQVPASGTPPSSAAPKIMASPPNTTVIQRATNEPVQPSTATTLQALLTEDGQVIDQGLVWRVFRDKPGPDGKRQLVAQQRNASPELKLAPGDYLVNVAFGRANSTRKIAVEAGKAQTEKFVINAGGVRVSPVLATGEPAPDKSVSIDIFSDERDRFGGRAQVMSGAKPGLIIRLNAGIYQIVSTYGDANAAVRTDITVEPGKLTEVTVAHTASKVTFKLVNRAGGEALAETQWTITSGQGEQVKESVGALPTHILAAGTYTVSAKHGGRVYRRDFAVKSDDSVEVEIVTR